MDSEISSAIIGASQQLREDVNKLTFESPTECVYNPLNYAWEPYTDYIRKYANSKKRIVFLGMNPGPWGMAQVGVPFGEIESVRDWLGIEGKIGKPEEEHPKRLIEGFECQRSEVSGRRLWGYFKSRFGKPENFFEEHFVLNYCPLVFMESTGRNRTPDKLLASERASLYAACDKHLKAVVECLEPEWLVGVGKFAAERFQNVFPDSDHKIDWILHPSPASPHANRDWVGHAEKKLLKAGIWTS